MTYAEIKARAKKVNSRRGGDDWVFDQYDDRLEITQKNGGVEVKVV